MKMCQPHWDALRKGIEERGMSGLIAGDGRKAAAAIQNQLDGTYEPKRDFDPLMSANFAIWSRGLECGGLYLMGADEDGNEYCPLCEADKRAGSGTADSWISGCLDAQLEHARELGLVPGVQ